MPSKKRQDERLDALLFPNDESDRFELNLWWHLARVNAAIRFLDEAKIGRLRSDRLAQRVMKANSKFSNSAERVARSQRDWGNR